MKDHKGVIIGFSGKMQTGKTTAAQYLVNEKGFEKKSYATELRDVTAYVFKLTPKELQDNDFKRSKIPGNAHDLTYRDLLIRTGAFARSIDPDFWVKRIDFSGRNIVVDDVRFLNEAERIKELGGILIRVERDSTPTLDDISETALDDYGGFDHRISNNCDFLSLYNNIDKVLEGISGFKLSA